MSETRGVIIDTCVWATYFQSPSDPYTREVFRLVQLNRAALILPIVAEVVVGIRNTGRAQWVGSALLALRVMPLVDRDWLDAAHLGRQMMSQGKKLPLIDLLIAATARRTQQPVLTTDPHFQMIPDLRLHQL